MARLLVVDDDPNILKLADRILTQAGHLVVTSADAMGAMEALNSASFDLMISDANMPMYSGFELVQTIRGNPIYDGMAIAMLTGLRERKDVERAVKAGVDDYIVKPLDPMLLVQKVDSVLERRQPQQKPEIRFAPQSDSGKGAILLTTQVESISEIGMVIRTNNPILEGTTLDISTPFFAQLGEKIPPLKVLSTDAAERDGEWRIQLLFLGAPETFLRKIRRYIFTHGASHRAVS